MTEKEYEDLLDMFSTDGWKYYINIIETTLDETTKSAADVCTTGEAWQLARGQILTLRQMAGYENFVRASNQVQEDTDVDYA